MANSRCACFLCLSFDFGIFYSYILSFVLISLAAAVGTFGVLDSTAYVENKWGKFGSAAAIFITTLLICLVYFQPVPSTGTDISGTVLLNDELVDEGKVLLIGTRLSENEYAFRENNPGYFEFNSVPDLESETVTLQITTNHPFTKKHKLTYDCTKRATIELEAEAPPHVIDLEEKSSKS